MVRSLDQIHRDQDRLEEATAKIDTQLSETYQQYLSVLGDAVRQQLILATYHLCTQSYPEAFLKLSLGQRETLQKRIRQLGQKGKTHINALESLDNVAATLNLLLQPHGQLGSLLAISQDQRSNEDDLSDPIDTQSAALLTTPPNAVNSEESAPNNAFLVPAQISHPFNSKALIPAATESVVKDDVERRANGSNPTVDIQNEASDPNSTHSPEPLSTPSNQPDSSKHPSPLRLAKRHVLLERQIRAILHALSSMTNHTLQQAKILPDLPEAVLTAASEASSDEPSPKVPNLLNIIIEIGQDEDAETEAEISDQDIEDLETSERTMTHLVAVNLRLADIEFTDTRTALWRSKIQEVLGQLKKLSRHYQKLQQERAQAEAEAAWRATWFEDKPSAQS